jgi:hypothetical protein
LPGGLPRLVRLRIATETGLAKEFANILKIHPVEKSRIVSVVRNFIGLRPYRRRHRLTVEGYLQAGIGREEGHLLPVVNTAIEWFRDQRVELPAFGVLMAMAEHALGRADHQIQNSFLEALGYETVIRLDNLLVEEGKAFKMVHCHKQLNSVCEWKAVVQEAADIACTLISAGNLPRISALHPH